jgi:hypothetical protein
VTRYLEIKKPKFIGVFFKCLSTFKFGGSAKIIFAKKVSNERQLFSLLPPGDNSIKLFVVLMYSVLG